MRQCLRHCIRSNILGLNDTAKENTRDWKKDLMIFFNVTFNLN